MPVTVYTSNDAAGPGPLPNTAGALVTILDACLVNGYAGKPAAGWDKVFASGATLGVYRPPEGTRFFCRVDDSAGPAARITGYEAMSDANTGTGPFPAPSQLSGGDYVIKHNAAAGNRGWILVADEKRFYFFSQWDTTVSGANGVLVFWGDLVPLRDTDQYHCFLMAANGATRNGGRADQSNDNGGVMSGISQACTGHFLARSHSGDGGSVAAGKHPACFNFTHTFSEMNNYGRMWISNVVAEPLPATVDGKIILAPMVVTEQAKSTGRGYMPGLWLLAHPTTWNYGDTLSADTGYFNGRAFVVVRVSGACYLIETSDTWEA